MGKKYQNRVYLDTETTGLHPENGDEILSLSIIDPFGSVLFDESFRPKLKTEWPGAEAVNHISPVSVAGLPTIDEHMEEIKEILEGYADEIVGYNVGFDIAFLKAAGISIKPGVAVIDTMRDFIKAFGNENKEHDYQTLAQTARRIGYEWTGAPHGSLADTFACRAAQECVDDHNWCMENCPIGETAIMKAVPIEKGSNGLPEGCWNINPHGRPFAVSGAIMNRLQNSAKLCARAGTTNQFTHMTVNQWFAKAERSRQSLRGRSANIDRAATALNSQHRHMGQEQDILK